MFLTKVFGVTGNDAQRDLSAEPRIIEEIVEKVLLLQANSAAQQKRPLGRGTHAKGTCARAEFEVFDVTEGREPALAARLARGIFAKPGIYPAIVRFGNSDPKINSDFKADVRSLSVSVDLTRNGTVIPDTSINLQDFSLQNATTLPINDAPAFLAIMKLLTASNPAAGLWSLSLKDKLRVMRTLALVQIQTHQKIKPYQQLRYWSNVPFRHGPYEAVKHSATPFPENPARPLERTNPNAMQDELGRHLKEDGKMSSFSFGLQFLDVEKMTYWGKRHDADFWTENASIEWKEVQSPFYTVARLTLVANSQLDQNAAAKAYFDVTANSAADSVPIGSINRARRQGEVASRRAREKSESSCVTTPPVTVYADVARP
jgi:hypothetical protein